MTLSEAIYLLEELPTIKFLYKNSKHDKHPETLVFDDKYPGRKGQKNYGEREDILGWNLNYYKNKKEAIDAIQDINSFGDLLSKNKEEKYKRIKYFYPEQSALLRRYQKKYIRFLRTKGENGLWTKGDL